MKTLGTDIEKYRNEVIAALESAESKLVEAIDGFNAELEAHRALVEAAVARYNEVVADAESLKADAQSSIQDYLDRRLRQPGPQRN
jgi:vacuolar-type H+-ATPase subunit H